jgi:hypothetical protein
MLDQILTDIFFAVIGIIVVTYVLVPMLVHYIAQPVIDHELELTGRTHKHRPGWDAPDRPETQQRNAWEAIDLWGHYSGETFHGTVDELINSITRGVHDISRVSVTRGQVWIAALDDQLECTVVTLHTPWGDVRYINVDDMP